MMEYQQVEAISREVARQRGTIAKRVTDMLDNLRTADNRLSSSRINSLAQSLAWHPERHSASDRLRAGCDEICRLHRIVGKRTPEREAECQFYQDLKPLVSPENTNDPIRTDVRNQLDLEGIDMEVFGAEADLQIALEAIRVLQVLERGRRVERDILDNHQGAFPWRQ